MEMRELLDKQNSQCRGHQKASKEIQHEIQLNLNALNLDQDRIESRLATVRINVGHLLE